MRWYNLREQRRPHSHWSYMIITIGGIAASYSIAMIVDIEREKKRRALGLRPGMKSPKYTSNLIIGRNSFTTWWKSRQESERTLISIIALNAGVFLAWRVPSLGNFLSKYFSHSLLSHPLTMATSMFSHVSSFHLLVNMVALYSFGRYLHDRMGREQFIAFYLSAGLLSSAGSHLWRHYRNDFSRSLGASGAIFGVAGASAHNPDLRVSLIFLPFFSVPISIALPALMAYDALGMYKGWSTFDHAAHLSGALSGYLGYSLSTQKIWPNRYHVLQRFGYPIK